MKKVLALFVLLSSVIFNTGCASEQQETSTNEERKTEDEISKKISEGIEVNAKILSNYNDINEAMVEIKLTNRTDDIFSGEVTLSGGWFDLWVVEFRAVPPQGETTKEIKLPYIEDPSKEYTVSIKGDFSEQFESEIEYTIIHQPKDTHAFYVQTEQVSKESAISIIKDLYSKYGEKLKHVSIYDMTLDEEIKDDNFVMPKADFFYNIIETTLTLYKEDGTGESVSFELP